MTPVQRTLLAIAAFVALAVGSFVYFIASWDATKTEPIGATVPAHGAASALILSNTLRGLGQRPSPAHPAGVAA